MSSLSVEEHPGAEVVVSLFEVPATPASVAAFIEREHEFRWAGPHALAGWLAGWLGWAVP